MVLWLQNMDSTWALSSDIGCGSQPERAAAEHPKVRILNRFGRNFAMEYCEAILCDLPAILPSNMSPHTVPACRMNQSFTGPRRSTAFKPNDLNPTMAGDLTE